MPEQITPAGGPSLLCQIREANKSFLAGTPETLDSTGEPFLLIACYDPRLTELLRPALGLPVGRAFMIRIAGNIITPASQDVFRSIAAALYVRQCKEILVLGHTDCAMATISVPQVIDAFRTAGVARSAFGDADLRDWFGAFTDIKANVFEGLESLKKASIVPSGIKMHGAVIDTVSGELSVIYDGDLSCRMAAAPAEFMPGKVVPSPAIIPPETLPVPKAPLSSAGSSPAGVPRTLKGPVIIPSPELPSERENYTPASLSEAAEILASFVTSERSNSKLRSDLLVLRNRARSDPNPMQTLKLLHQTALGYATRHPRLPGALEYFVKRLENKDITAKEMLHLLHIVMEKV